MHGTLIPLAPAGTASSAGGAQSAAQAQASTGQWWRSSRAHNSLSVAGWIALGVATSGLLGVGALGATRRGQELIGRLLTRRMP